jgi:hypothetical protein
MYNWATVKRNIIITTIKSFTAEASASIEDQIVEMMKENHSFLKRETIRGISRRHDFDS